MLAGARHHDRVLRLEAAAERRAAVGAIAGVGTDLHLSRRALERNPVVDGGERVHGCMRAHGEPERIERDDAIGLQRGRRAELFRAGHGGSSTDGDLRRDCFYDYRVGCEAHCEHGLIDDPEPEIESTRDAHRGVDRGGAEPGEGRDECKYQRATEGQTYGAAPTKDCDLA